MKIHIHDIPGQPVLLSVKSRAVIDFERDEAIFRRLDPRKVVSLETTDSGHQLFPVVGDVMARSASRGTPFSTLRDDHGNHIPSVAAE